MKQRLHTHLNQLVPSIADRVRNKQSQQKAAHDYHAKEREILEGQAVYAKDFRYKRAWLPGTVLEKTGPVSARVQLDNWTVIRRHQDHFRRPENDVAEEPVVSVTPNVTPSVTPVVLPERDATSTTPGVSDQLEVPKSPSAAPQTPVKTTSLVTRPVRKRVRPGYLKDYLCE